jgi:peptidoglycan/LPS O-acetylase OafA/YrhL
MKKIILLVSLLALMIAPVIVLGQTDQTDQTDLSDPSSAVAPTIQTEEAIQNAINVGFWVIMTASVLAFLLGGLYFLSGKEDNVKKGKQIIMWAIVAIVVALLARGIPNFMESLLDR